MHCNIFTPLFPHEINRFSNACFLLTLTLIELHRITCWPIFTRYVLSGRNRAFNSLVGFGPGLDSKCQDRAEKKKKKKRASPTLCSVLGVLS